MGSLVTIKLVPKHPSQCFNLFCCCFKSLGAGNPTPGSFYLFALECHKPDLDLQTTVSEKSPSRLEDEHEKSREKARIGKERLYLLHKGHSTQVTATKMHQERLKSPGSPAVQK
ncbi:hypothetical protein TNCV_2998991 [Trichonephila clavipes]|nr:hypothetical protein TNCV_2998991 [Trichonephila clavipes]